MYCSIIIPTKNRHLQLYNTLQSIIKLNSNTNLFEIIIVDNGSIDDTKKIVDDFILNNSSFNIIYFYDETPGLLTGRHVGAKLSNFEILCFIDDDVILSNDWLNGIIDIMKNRSDISLLTGPCLPIFETEPPKWLNYFSVKTKYGGYTNYWLSLLDLTIEEVEVFPTYVMGLNYIIRKSDFYFLEGFNPDSMPTEFQIFQGDGETGLSIKAFQKNKIALYNSRVKLFHVIPKERLTIEYFKKRAYFQGVSDSYSSIRNRIHEKESTNNIILFFKILLRNLRKSKKFLYLKTNIIINYNKYILLKTLNLEYKNGFKFHNKSFKNISSLKLWVLKNNYLDKTFPFNN